MTYVWIWSLAAIAAILVIFFTLYWLAMRGEAAQRQLREPEATLARGSRPGSLELDTNRMLELPSALDDGLRAPP